MSQAELIAQYVEPHPQRGGAAEARIKGRGVAIWAIVGSMLLTHGDDAAQRVAHAYRVPAEAVLAAMAYYQQPAHKGAIDARLEANVA